MVAISPIMTFSKLVQIETLDGRILPATYSRLVTDQEQRELIQRDRTDDQKEQPCKKDD